MELTTTEYKVAELVARGYSEKEIASELFISPSTVHNHTYNIRKKWNARSCVDVARKFILGLENPKRYFAALALLIIQFHIILNCGVIDMRRSSRNNIRTYKIARKIT